MFLVSYILTTAKDQPDLWAVVIALPFAENDLPDCMQNKPFLKLDDMQDNAICITWEDENDDIPVLLTDMDPAVCKPGAGLQIIVTSASAPSTVLRVYNATIQPKETSSYYHHAQTKDASQWAIND